MISLRRAGGALAIGAIAYLLFWPIALEPEVYHPSPDPGLTGAFAPNRLLERAERLPLPEGGEGPEDLAVLGGAIYTAGADGWLYRLTGARFEKADELGGRPLGLNAGPDGALYITDSYRGLMRWTPDGGLTPLVQEIDGKPIHFANQLDVARDGTVYFTISSARFPPETAGGAKASSVMTIFEQSQTGYVARWTPDGSVEKIATGFVFANGVGLSPDEDYLLIAETGRAAIHRHWLKGPKAGTQEPFLTGLPAYPDNIEMATDGSFWVGFASPRVSAEALMPYPFLRKLLWRLGPAVRPAPLRHGIVAQYDAKGQVIRVLQDARGALGITTGAKIIGDQLYVSFLEGGFVARLPIATLPQEQG